MFGSAVLEVAVGLVFIYLIVSLMVTAATELIAAWLAWRAKHLRYGIRTLLNSPEAEDWAQKLYDHPAIKGLYQASSATFSLVTFLSPFRRGPSYIASRTFSTVLLDLVRKSDASFCEVYDKLQSYVKEIIRVPPTDTPKAALLRFAERIQGASPVVAELKSDLLKVTEKLPDADPSFYRLKQGVQRILDGISDLNATPVGVKKELQVLLDKYASPGSSLYELKQDLQQIVNRIPYSGSVNVKKDLQALLVEVPSSSSAPTDVTAILESFLHDMDGKYFRILIDQLPNAHLRAALGVLMEEAGHDPESLKANIERWFNEAMDRVSGWYKRKTQLAHLALGIAFVFALNIDSIVLMQFLSSNAALREIMVAQAKEFIGQTTVPTNQVEAATPLLNASAPAEVSPVGVTHSPAIAMADILGMAQPTNGTSPDGLASAERLTDIKTVAVSGADEFIAATNPAASSRNPGAASTNPPANESIKHDATRQEQLRPLQSYHALKANLDQLNLPIGWTFITSTALHGTNEVVEDVSMRNWPGWPSSTGAVRQWWHTLRFHFSGWLATVLAVSLGAPFWFDLLDKIVTIRSTGDAPPNQQHSTA